MEKEGTEIGYNPRLKNLGFFVGYNLGYNPMRFFLAQPYPSVRHFKLSWVARVTITRSKCGRIVFFCLLLVCFGLFLKGMHSSGTNKSSAILAQSGIPKDTMRRAKTR